MTKPTHTRIQTSGYLYACLCDSPFFFCLMCVCARAQVLRLSIAHPSSSSSSCSSIRHGITLSARMACPAPSDGACSSSAVPPLCPSSTASSPFESIDQRINAREGAVVLSHDGFDGNEMSVPLLLHCPSGGTTGLDVLVRRWWGSSSKSSSGPPPLCSAPYGRGTRLVLRSRTRTAVECDLVGSSAVEMAASVVSLLESRWVYRNNKV